MIDGDIRLSWRDVAQRSLRLAGALNALGIGKNQTVSMLAPNSAAMYEAHFGVPMAGAVLNTINTRLDAATIAFILEHAKTEVFLVDSELAGLAGKAVSAAAQPVTVIEIASPGMCRSLEGVLDYEAFLDTGDPSAGFSLPDDEWDAISLNYTSGTTGNPKGVVYHHRGAYLNALSNAVGWQMPHHPVYLWTLPMFHCNGWCFPWTLAAIAGTSVCLRQVNAQAIYSAISEHRVSHFCGAPVIMGMVVNAAPEERREFSHPVRMMTAAAPPPASVLSAMEEQGFEVTHVYGLTETYGPAVMCAWKDRWNELDSQARAEYKSRQGVPYHALEGLEVLNPEGMGPVIPDGEEMGEVMFRGNIVMKGYLGNPEATEDAFSGGWFHSGDLGVTHDDEYIQLKDRSKDIIISGGENISSIEIEGCLYRHPDILEAAVVARSDEKWGEVPCAFVERVAGSTLTARDVIDFCRDNLAHFKVPKSVIFQQIPKTSTGKVRKFRLRQQVEDA